MQLIIVKLCHDQRDSPIFLKEEDSGCFLKGSPVSFTLIELKTSSVNICVIDDCKDADIPILETTLCHLHLTHQHNGKGSARAQISSSYYNRRLSAWEPCLEPWICSLNWTLNQAMVGAQVGSLAVLISCFLNLVLS